MSLFQYAIDNAESISMERKGVVASTETRAGVLRTTTRIGSVWQFDVKLPDGISWQELRPYISNLEYCYSNALSDTIQFNNSDHAWLSQYQGNSVNYTGFVASITNNSQTITLTTSPTTSSGYKFKAGDFIQLGSSGRCYTVQTNVAYNSNTVILNRPVLESSATGVSLKVGPNAVWTCYLKKMPKWTIFARDQVAWDGPLTFVERFYP